MMRLPRFLTCIIALSITLGFAIGRSASAQEATAPVAAADQQLKTDVENFWHYAKVARYDLAAAEAQKVLAKKDQPVAVLEAFEAVAAERKDNLDQWMLRWQQADALKNVSADLISVLNEGYRTRRADQNFIESNIKRLNVNERAYATAVVRLRESGELAVPLMVDYLRDPARKQYHAAIRRALKEMGQPVLNPLVTATQVKDADTLASVVNVLGDKGYNAPVPYLAKIAADKDTPDAARNAAAEALARHGLEVKNINAADLFYQLGEKFYYNKTDIAADSRSNVAYVWYWDTEKGLMKQDVPPAIFSDIMAMRAAEYVLKLDPTRADAVSLWLAANYKREANLPVGAKDPTRAENQPSAHYYGVAAGTQYLNPVLARALRDHDAAVALRAIKSLQQIVGQSNLFSGGAGEPVVDATHYPDRMVRFEAAFALAAALPQKPFAGSERVVPVLAEAVAQTGKASVLVLAGDQNEANALVQGLKDAGYIAAGGDTADKAVAAAALLPAVDVILVTESVKAAEVERIFQLTGASPKLESAARIVTAKIPTVSPFAAAAANNPMLSVIVNGDAKTMQPEIEAARKKAGSLPLNDKLATEYAIRSADLLNKLAVSRTQALDLSAAENTLLMALDDSRSEIVKAAGGVLAMLNSKSAQTGLAIKAMDDKTADDVKIALYKVLATSAKFWGNLLDPAQVDAIQKAVESEKNLDVRTAAAEARGALNLPAELAKSLISAQSTVK